MRYEVNAVMTIVTAAWWLLLWCMLLLSSCCDQTQLAEQISSLSLDYVACEGSRAEPHTGYARLPDGAVVPTNVGAGQFWWR